jgi:hypothetical protein
MPTSNPAAASTRTRCTRKKSHGIVTSGCGWLCSAFYCGEETDNIFIESYFGLGPQKHVFHFTDCEVSQYMHKIWIIFEAFQYL